MSTRIQIIQPDDWHIHLRDEEKLTLTTSDASKQFARAIVMPNLKPPVTTVAQALEYRERILAACPQGTNFKPLMTLYLTDTISTDELTRAKENEHIHAVKLYPAGATTNSQAGVQDLSAIYPLLAHMEKIDLPLLIHGEITDSHKDIFDREALFIEQHLEKIVREFPNLRIVFEHITTKEAAQFVQASSKKIAATITAHHLLYNRNDMLSGGIRPHFYCLPILKRNTHQQALIDAATSGDPSFFLGTDSAPHVTGQKESSCGCAGCYTAYAAIELYAEAFDQANALDKLEGFASFYGADFYQLPRNTNLITLEKTQWQAPKQLNFGSDTLTPLRAGESIQWMLIN